jgi:hypothetical protein
MPPSQRGADSQSAVSAIMPTQFSTANNSPQECARHISSGDFGRNQSYRLEPLAVLAFTSRFDPGFVRHIGTILRSRRRQVPALNRGFERLSGFPGALTSGERTGAGGSSRKVLCAAQARQKMPGSFGKDSVKVLGGSGEMQGLLAGSVYI